MGVIDHHMCDDVMCDMYVRDPHVMYAIHVHAHVCDPCAGVGCEAWDEEPGW